MEVRKWSASTTKSTLNTEHSGATPPKINLEDCQSFIVSVSIYMSMSAYKYNTLQYRRQIIISEHSDTLLSFPGLSPLRTYMFRRNITSRVLIAILFIHKTFTVDVCHLTQCRDLTSIRFQDRDVFRILGTCYRLLFQAFSTSCQYNYRLQCHTPATGAPLPSQLSTILDLCPRVKPTTQRKPYHSTLAG